MKFTISLRITIDIVNVDKAVKSWKNLFFQNKLFIEKYFKYLKKYSDKEYLDKFFSNN